MADQLKKRRSIALGAFTRTANTLESLMEQSAPIPLVTEQYEKVQMSWEKLEAAHEEFLEKTDIDIEVDADGLRYLDKPNEKRESGIASYVSYLKVSALEQKEEASEKEKKDEKRRKGIVEGQKLAASVKVDEEKKEKLNSLKAEFYSEMESFKGLSKGFRAVLHDISPDDKRREWRKLEDEFKGLKNLKRQIASIDHKADLTGVVQAYTIDVEETFQECQRLVLMELKDIPLTSGGEQNSSSTKKEAVRLPSFSGDERSSPYLKFSIWKKQWDVLISEYEPKWRAGLLWDHLDDTARSKYIGCEINYDEAMKRLERFYGDPVKVISCVMKEVLSFPLINCGEYKHLIAYSLTLENNFNRLVSLGLEHEMSNTSSMGSILKRFPRSVVEKWNEFLCTLDRSAKMKPFAYFIKWLETQREVWERMVSSEAGNRTPSVHFGDVSSRSDKRSCFSCGEEGHIRRFCPKAEGKKARRKPMHKKFWCAYHRDDDSRVCWSGSCQDLKRISDVSERIRLLNENGDCIHCCGDHDATVCSKKDRKCGGDKPERGCSIDHNTHELFCPNAKLCFTANRVLTTENDSECVVLSIMKVRGYRRGQVVSVFWDSGCTSNFVREAYAQSCGFKGRREDLSIMTIGGQITDYSVTNYDCTFRDNEGTLHQFEAYGLDRITQGIGKLGYSVIKDLFPHLSEKEVHGLERLEHVDFLIGMKHASWHPERVEKSKKGGDRYIEACLEDLLVGAILT